MRTGFWHRIKRKVRQMPEVDPKDEAWARIIATISFEKRLQDIIPEMPEINPKHEVWENISGKIKINDIKVRGIKPEKHIVYLTAAAAIAVMVISVFYLINNRTHIEITVNEEYVFEDSEPELVAVTYQKADPLVFIEQSCKRQKEICNNYEFIEKKELLNELELELKKINNIIEKYGESPALIKSLIKIENMRSEIIREVIKMLNA